MYCLKFFGLLLGTVGLTLTNEYTANFNLLSPITKDYDNSPNILSIRMMGLFTKHYVSWSQEPGHERRSLNKIHLVQC